jgi:hypothetical protein
MGADQQALVGQPTDHVGYSPTPPARVDCARSVQVEPADEHGSAGGEVVFDGQCEVAYCGGASCSADATTSSGK